MPRSNQEDEGPDSFLANSPASAQHPGRQLLNLNNNAEKTTLESHKPEGRHRESTD